MNGQEQKNHKRVTDELRKDLDTLKSDMGILLGGVANTAQDRTSKVQANLDALAVAHNERLDAQKVALESAGDKFLFVSGRLTLFARMGFWARCGWILFGRLPR